MLSGLLELPVAADGSLRLTACKVQASNFNKSFVLRSSGAEATRCSILPLDQTSGRGYSLFVYVLRSHQSARQTSPDVPLPEVSLLLLPLRPESDCDRKAFRVGCFLTLPPTNKDIGLR